MSRHPSDPHNPQLLSRLVTHQVQSLYPNFEEGWCIDAELMRRAIDRTIWCVQHFSGPMGRFDPLLGGHHATLLYFVSCELAAVALRHDAARVFLTNKALHGIDLFHEVEMHPVFAIGHTVGMVFAKATYGPRCVFHQGCTVGRDGDRRPVLEEGVVMYPNSSILGDCHVRANTAIAPGVNLVNTDTPGDCVVFMGEHGRPLFKPAKDRYADRYLKPLEIRP
ncbi:MAG: hypothetical protein EBR10_07700 [Planctomycetes bacterium]|nr:hypothetical protein [Planctomycetota bacterium]